MLTILHWVAKDVLPDKLWVRWLRWRYQSENQPKPKRGHIYNYADQRAAASAPHRPGRGICDCAACNPSGATITC